MAAHGQDPLLHSEVRQASTGGYFAGYAASIDGAIPEAGPRRSGDDEAARVAQVACQDHRAAPAAGRARAPEIKGGPRQAVSR
jgi:hypothetical protein